MAPVMRKYTNGLKMLITYNDVIDKLSKVGWLGFVPSFYGFSIEVAREFAKNFDGTKVKVGDVQL
jgi:hypothetical protein